MQFILKSSIGNIFICANNQGLTAVSWKNRRLPLLSSSEYTTKRSKIIKETIRQIQNYLNKQQTAFDLPIILNGTKFQMNVWNELKKIPFGETVSYSDIAERIGKPRAVRAIGTANGQNPISIIIPCHRVIAKNGSIAGYAGGVDIKRKLLKLENNKIE